ncbi:phosphotransferase [Brachybacterium sp. AOP43-C2-M15]|uniref:phosphotransferase n=1 Tax=Brachybacterium sp. AOP43-C2-M15 TaxID=3457661 RepID=UPI0040338A79
MTHRRTWDDFPPALRGRLERLLGGSVVSTRSCTGGFSPSSAEVLTAASGRELFVKAVRDLDNPRSRDLNRAEARVLASLPASAPVPALVDAFAQGEWFVLVTEVARGALPGQPWTPAQLDKALDALDALQAVTTPCPLDGLRSVVETLGPDMLGFEQVAADPPEDLDPWIRERLDALRAAAKRGIEALDGDTLCHADVRADNMLLADDGTVRFVDWAWASRGSRVADALQLLSSVEDPGGSLGVNARVDAVLAAHDLPRQVGTDVFAGVLGFFVDAARWPHEPSLPFLLPHRRARRDSLLPLVRERWD